MTNNSTPVSRKIITWSAWSFVGVVLALLFFYWQEYRERYDFRIEINDTFNLIEIRESVKDLKVLYRDEDIVESKNEIKVARITIRNLGETILQNYYDNLEVFGLSFPKANILSFTIIDSSSEDLRKKIIPEKVSNDNEEINKSGRKDKIILSKVIFEKDDFVTFKVVLMQHENSNFSIIPLGKIANIDKLNIVYAPLQDERDSRNREPFYVVAGLFSFLVALAAIGITLDYREKRKKSLRVDAFYATLEHITESQRDIAKLYINSWTPSQKYLLKRVIDGEDIISVRQYVKDRLVKGHLSVFSILALLVTKAGTLTHISSQIYKLHEQHIMLNDKNKEFICDFFRNVVNENA